MNYEIIVAAFAPMILMFGAMALAVWKDLREEKRNNDE